MRHRHISGSIVLFSCAALVTACRQDGTGGTLDTDAYAHTSNVVVTTEAALEVSDDVLGFDPVLDRMQTADQNAMAVAMHATDALVGCGTVSRTGTAITIEFGTTPCTTPSGHVVTGTMSLAVGVMAGEATATFTFTSFTVDGSSLSGTLGFATRLTGLTVDVALTSGTSSIAGSATIGATTGAFSLSADLTATRSGTTTSISIRGLVWTRGDCYPSAGTVTATTGRLVQSITFSAATAMSGTVSVTEGPFTTTQTLPAYGDCPVP